VISFKLSCRTCFGIYKILKKFQDDKSGETQMCLKVGIVVIVGKNNNLSNKIKIL